MGFPDLGIGCTSKQGIYHNNPNKFRFRKVVCVLGLVFLFIKNLREKTNKPAFSFTSFGESDLPSSIVAPSQENKYLVTTVTDPKFLHRGISGRILR